jgi:predicted O-linked N-acetylglucosamine transferase (SPINDLY family)
LAQAEQALMRNDRAAAIAATRAALRRNRSSVSAWHLLGRAAKGNGDLDTAMACYRRALAVDPRDPALLTSLGAALAAANEPERAVNCYERALAIDPRHAGAAASLNLLRPRSRPPGSTQELQQLIAQADRSWAAGRLPEALACYRQALLHAPAESGLWTAIGLLLVGLGMQQAALAYFEEGARLDPVPAIAAEAARRLCVGNGLPDRAARFTPRGAAHALPQDREIALSLTVPAIVDSLPHIASCRLAYAAALEHFAACRARIQDVIVGHVPSAFFLAYHGENDGPLQSKLARFLGGAIADLRTEAPHCPRAARSHGRIRVGFASAFLHDHSIGKTTRGLLTELRRDLFEVWAIRVMPSSRDAITERIFASADHALELDPDFRRAREQIASLELDVLFYQDIGMDATTYRIASSRLAPVQCVSYGHPDTTGLAEMDYFVSNDWYEPADSDAHYTERLFLLRELPTLAYYYRPPVPPAVERSSFGLHEDDHVYVCPQALFKLHPDMDSAFARILQCDAAAIIVLIRAPFDDWTERLQARLRRNLGPDASRIHWIDRMTFTRFLQLLRVADVALDTWHFNGMNSSLEALAMGLPVVTLPGRFQRGRHTQAMYRAMGIPDGIAASESEYVEIALRIAADPAYARSLRQRIEAASGVLFENPRVVREFERFFLTATRAARPGWAWPTAMDRA